jgi:hypothetical protein
VILLTVLLLLLYYLTPNNYTIELFDSSKYNLIKEYVVKIKSGTHISIPNSDSDNNFLKFVQLDNSNVPTEFLITSTEFLNTSTEFLNTPIEKSNNIYLLVKNVIKSQSLIYNQDELVHTRYGSTIIIPNQFENEIDIKILIYKK